MAETTIEIRLYRPADRHDRLALSSRLADWVATWRDPVAVLAAVRGWVEGSLDALNEPGHAVYVAASDEAVVGFVTVTERTHFTGQVDAYVGELAVREGL